MSQENVSHGLLRNAQHIPGSPPAMLDGQIRELKTFSANHNLSEIKRQHIST